MEAPSKEPTTPASMTTAASWTALLGGPSASLWRRHPGRTFPGAVVDLTADRALDPDGCDRDAQTSCHDDGDDALDVRRHHDALLVDDRPHPRDFDMRTLIGAVERVHLLRACMTSAGATGTSPLIETTIVRLAHGAWVRAPYVHLMAPMAGRNPRAHLCDLLARVYGPFWSHLARADATRQPTLAGRIGNPPTPADVLRCLRRDFGLSRIEAARIKAAAPNDPIGAADTIARIFCGIGIELAGPTAVVAHQEATEAAIAEGAAFVRAVAECRPVMTAAVAPPAPAATSCPTLAVPPRLLLVGVASGCPSSVPDGTSHSNGTRFALVASRIASTSSSRKGAHVWRWAAWVLWDTRARVFWEASDEPSMRAADAAVGESSGHFVAWLRAAALRPGTALPSGALAPQPPDACRPVDALLMEVAALVTSRLVDPRIADAVRVGVSRSVVGWAPLWDDRIAPYVRAVSVATPRQ